MKTNHSYSLPESLPTTDNDLISSNSETAPEAIVGALTTIQAVGDKGATGSTQDKPFVPAGHESIPPIPQPPLSAPREEETIDGIRYEVRRKGNVVLLIPIKE